MAAKICREPFNVRVQEDLNWTQRTRTARVRVLLLAMVLINLFSGEYSPIIIIINNSYSRINYLKVKN